MLFHSQNFLEECGMCDTRGVQSQSMLIDFVRRQSQYDAFCVPGAT